MNEKIFLLWTGWGVVFLGVHILFILSHPVLLMLLGIAGRTLRGSLFIGSSIALFVSSGFVGGLISFVVGTTVGVVLANWLTEYFGLSREKFLLWLHRDVIPPEEYKRRMAEYKSR